MGGAHGFGTDLTPKVYFQSGIDRDKIRMPGDYGGIIHIADRQELHSGVLMDVGVYLLPQTKGSDSQPGVEGLFFVGDGAAPDQIHHTIGQQFRMQPKVMLAPQYLGDRLRDRAHPKLNGGSVGDLFRYQTADGGAERIV